LVKNSAHAKYFKAVFSNRKFVEFDSIAEARNALLGKSISAVFSDAVSHSFWLTSKAADNCCQFVGGAYLSREYFGNGLTIAVAKGNLELVEAINFALKRINTNGTFRELYLRYFPIGLY
jgi:polar amino acid transport system substrate-binding protein